MGDHSSAKEVMNSTTSRGAMLIGKGIQTPNDWNEKKGEAILSMGLKAKFANPQLCEKLKNTLGHI